MAHLDFFLKLMATQEADRLRLRAGAPPELIVGRKARSLNLPEFTDRQLRDFVREITHSDDLAKLHAEGRVSLHYEYGEKVYVCDLMADEGKVRAVFRRAGAPSEGGTNPGVEARAKTDPRAAVSARGTRRTGTQPGVRARSLSTGRQATVPDTDPTEPDPLDAPVTSPEMHPHRIFEPDEPMAYSRAEATRPPGYGDDLSREEIDSLLRWMVEQDATDLHLTPKFPPTLRVDNLFQPSQGRALPPPALKAAILSLLDEHERRLLEKNLSVDLAYSIEDVGRFRINIFQQIHGLSAAIRHIPANVASMEDLNLPLELKKIVEESNGLVLFTGPTGSGKSTSMAALIEQMNKTRQEHILTLEQPIEYLFTNRRCLIQQREVGTHVPTFHKGLRDALRENPDIIMVGELRDVETVQLALTAAETGHLILATLHSATTNNAVSRLIDIFPEGQKSGVRAMIADVLRWIVNIRLLTHRSGRGLVPAIELLRNTVAIQSLIRENKLHHIRQTLTTHGKEGMFSFERYLCTLFRQGKVNHDEAYRYAPDKKMFEQLLHSRARVER